MGIEKTDQQRITAKIEPKIVDAGSNQDREEHKDQPIFETL